MNRYRFVESRITSKPLTTDPQSGEIWVGKKNQVALLLRDKIRGNDKRTIWNASFQAGTETRFTEVSTDTLLMDYKKK